MGSYWDGVKKRWKAMTGEVGPPPKNTGGGPSGTGHGYTGTGPGGPQPGKEWELVYWKFREIERRDPYSFQELVDWWNRA